MWPFWFVAVLDVIQMAEAIEMPSGVKTGVESEDPHSDGGLICAVWRIRQNDLYCQRQRCELALSLL